MRIVVFGGAGFVGSAVSRMLVAEAGATVLVVDKLTSSSSLASLAPVAASPRYSFRQADICDSGRIAALLQAFAPDAVVHAAAATGCGNGAATADAGFAATWRLMEAVRDYWTSLPEARRAAFRVAGIAPANVVDGSPDAARAAAADVMLSWHKAYGLPVMAARSATAFGPYQFPDATIPTAILSGLEGEAHPIAGPARDWIFIDDLAAALIAILKRGEPGATYTVTGRGRAGLSDIQHRIEKLVRRHAPPRAATRVSAGLAEAATPDAASPYQPLDGTRLEQDTGWRASETLDSALSKTVRWYMANEAWWRPLDAARTAGDIYGLLRTA